MSAPDPAAVNVDADWVDALRRRASQPPRRTRLPLWLAGHEIGSVEPGFLEQIDLQRSPALREVLEKKEHSGQAAWHLGEPGTAGPGVRDGWLAALADALREAGLAGQWRDEMLAVHGPDGTRLGRIERAAVRPLGIATRAVHLVGCAADGRVWVQQRAWNKANDPGLWDTLMGGMIAADDTLDSALARETWEEAGLRLTQLLALRHGGAITFSGPMQDAGHAMGGAGYRIETIDWYTATLPDGCVPVNRDGEVERFDCVSPQALLAGIRAGAYTLEAALISLAALGGSPCNAAPASLESKPF